ncbi:hypothetical protein OPU71_11520 [Niveibacterium sp. 24ML]|uniref:hypothetical protein n=1 Tax=Niveibacterium sp. 24ML TaxID=2985512 RepID=UPI00226FB46D|nr:hypothetical protein [Niveibacterium sp. 24ML]MCX9156754.1 hypothetical protein [Niveibacterium sp. 24ML]
MHRISLSLLGIALALASAPALPQASDNKLPRLVIETGRQYAQRSFPRAATWQGFYCDKAGCTLKPAQLRIETGTARNVLDEDEALDVLATDGAPLALFPDMALNAGKVVSWYWASGDPAESLPEPRLSKLGKWVMPWSTRPLTLSWVKTPEGYKRYHLSDGTTKQFLFSTAPEGHYGGDTTPIIHWAGDLDGDGMLDLLLSIPDDNCGFDERLYLSSGAGEGKLLRKAAQSVGREAACGC